MRFKITQRGAQRVRTEGDGSFLCEPLRRICSRTKKNRPPLCVRALADDECPAVLDVDAGTERAGIDATAIESVDIVIGNPLSSHFLDA